MTHEPSVGFPPVARADARVLILGSLPGQASLAATQYYAQKHNAFWPIMGRLFGAGPEAAYDARLAALIENRVALWDVCLSAQRPGSLDHKIDRASVVANDFAGFFAAHREISHVFFNGAAAEQLYLRLARPRLAPPAVDLPTTRLPSTSPAHASLVFAKKLAAWEEVRRKIFVT
jgi:TDG/mug DNA glycosylase family protein